MVDVRVFCAVVSCCRADWQAVGLESGVFAMTAGGVSAADGAGAGGLNVVVEPGHALSWEGPLTATEVQAAVGMHPRGTRDFLDTLVSLGMLDRADGRYGNSAAAASYLVPTAPTYLGGFLGLTTRFMGPGFDSLAQTLRNGSAHREEARGEVPFAQIFRDPDKLRSFLAAMDSLNGPIGPALAEVLPAAEARTFVDLGGARGNLAASLVTRHPHLHGTVLDRPAMLAFFDEKMAELGTAGQVDFRGGDFFVDEVPAVDMAVFGNVLHDFSAEQRVQLIGRVHERLPDGGVIVIYDPMIDDDRTDTDTLLMSLSMMLQSPGGSEYTAAECRGYLVASGFEVLATHRLPASATAVIGRKIPG
jgi:hypothetical protein